MLVAGRQFSAAEVTRLWHSGMPRHLMCSELNCTMYQLKTMITRLKLPHRQRLEIDGGGPLIGDPDEDEIKRRAEAIQSEWTPEERERRRVFKSYRPKIRNYLVVNRRSVSLQEAGLP